MTRALMPPVIQANVWATVTAVSPLDIQIDGEPGSLGINLDAFTLVGGLQVGDRVWVELSTNTDPKFAGRHAVIIGKAGGATFSPLDAYPVGAVYVSTDGTAPGTLFGGTWSQITDVFLLAAGSTYAAGATGGEAEHTLTAAETPAHDHGSAGGHTHASVSANGATAGGAGGPVFGIQPSGGGNAGVIGTLTDNQGTHTHTSVGSGAAHNNMPPYLVVYVWKRTA